MKHSFSSGRYDIVFATLDGITVYPDIDDEGCIYINPRMSESQILETLIHEAIHAEFPELEEDRVLVAGRNIRRLLRRLGYERNSQ